MRRSWTSALLAAACSMLLLAAACGSDDADDSTSPESTTTTAPADDTSTATVDIYLVDTDAFATGTEPYVVAVERAVDADDAIVGAVDALFDGPDADDEAAGLELVASGATGADVIGVEDGVARVQLVGGCDSGGSTMTIAQQLIPTLQQFDEVDVVTLLDPDGATADDASTDGSTPECLEP